MLRSVTLIFSLASLTCLAQSPVACFPFTAGDPGDATGNGHNGTLSGPQLVADRFGSANSAYSFDGVNDHIVLPALGNMISSDEFSVSFWLKADISAPQAVLITQPDIADDRFNVGPHYNHNGDNSIFWDYGNIFSGGRCSVIPFALTTTWQHWVFVHSVVENRMTVHLDGAVIDTEAHSSAIIDRSRPVWIGGGVPTGGGSFHFHGDIDDVMFFNSALDAGEAAALYGDQVLSAPCSFVGIAEAEPLNTPLITVANGSLLVAWPHGPEHGNVELLDTSGRVVLAPSSRNGERWSVALDAMPSGVYLVRCVTGDGTFVGRVAVP